MLKKTALLAFVAMLSACSLSSYVPFMGNKKPVINLEQEKIDQKSYAAGYASTTQTYREPIKSDYDVNSFAQGVKDWNDGRILVSIEQIKAKMAQGIDSNVHAYYSGVVFASELQTNFNRLSKTCWTNIDRNSLTQGIYDAMLDIKNGKVRSENDEYLVKGNDALLKVCQ
ncbi:MAG: hypothetical protein Q4A81_04940 [Pasteurellaceae bacterium]|nr:hypothetical protein [Pasteurellaceae bacterium]